MLLGTGYRHIQQAALLLQLPHRGSRNRTRENVLLQTHHENRGKFQTLRRMNRHQRNPRLILLAVTVGIRQQRHILQEIRQECLIHPALLLALSHKGLHTAQELLQVLLSCQVVGILALHDILADSRLLDDGIAQGIHIKRMRAVDERTDQQSEILQLCQGTLVHVQPVMRRLAYHLPDAHLVLVGAGSHLCHRGSTDAARRIIDDSLNRLLIVRICHESEISDDILDFLALVEAQSAIDAVRNALLSELLLEASALGISAVENGEIIIAAIVLALDALDVLRHNQRLLLVAVGWLILYLLALGIPAEHLLGNLVAVAANQTVCRLHDGLRTAVVLLQLEEAGTRQLMLEVEDIVDVGATETVDALRVIAHGTHAQLLPAQLHHDRHLHMVGILILIHQDKVKPLGILASHLLMVSEKLEGKHQQVVEIHGVRLLAPLHILPVHLAHLLHVAALVLHKDVGIGIISLRTQQVVLRLRNLGVHGSRLVGFLVQPLLLHYRLDERTGVGFIIDGKIAVESDMLRLGTQDAGEDAVEGAHVEMLSQVVAHQFSDTLLHLAGRLVGKGECHDAPGLHTLLQQIGNLISKHTRLSGTCAGYHQRRSIYITHSLLLRFVQVFQ